MSDDDAKNEEAVAGEDGAADEGAPEEEANEAAREQNEVHLDAKTCPHCGKAADPVPSVDLRFECPLCGRARVPFDAELHRGHRDGKLARTHQEAKALARATASRDAATAWQVIAGFTAGFSAFAVGVLALVVSVAKPAAFGSGVGFVVSLVPLAFAGYAFSRARANRSRIDDELGRAWQMVARELLAEDTELTADDLGKLLSLPAEPAKQLFAAAKKA